MKKGQVYEGIVTEIDFPNKGIVFIDETVNDSPSTIIHHKIIVKNALLGQRIRFSVNKIRKGKCEGRLLEVLSSSPLETETDLCNCFGFCGGCTYQSISYEKQLELKKNQVKKLIDSVCDSYEFEGILGSPNQWEYRNKMEYSFGDEIKDGPLTLGMHKKGSFHDIINTNECKIVDSDYNVIVSCVLAYCQKEQLPFYKKMSHQGFLRHLLLRRAVKTKEMTISIVTTSQQQFDFSPLCRRLLELPLKGKIVGILHIINDSLADVVQSDSSMILYGKDWFYEELLGMKFKISTFSFFQTNSLGAEVLYQKTREYIGDINEKLIFDLYSGTGTIAQILAPVAKKVIGVEIVEEAVSAARENASLNGLTNCQFIAGDVLKVIDSIEEKPDLIVLDPPRDGIHPKALQKIINFGVSRIVYISCKPTSLARDLVMLQEQGYRVEKVCAVDMFPMTVHVETICLLCR